ncbi:MAG TPA: hypothetical protein VNT60_08245 [Deinococcales bacterium]|nr:hypothetical protein [Deinococcales bacterium]
MIEALPGRRPRGDRPRTGPPRLLPDAVQPAVPFSERHVAMAQAGLYVLTGLWPIVSLGSFELVTGKKRDEWLVKTTGALITCVGAALAQGARARKVSPETRTLAVASALTLAGADVIYVLRGRIRPVYLLDAAAELAIAAGWAVAIANEGAAGRPRDTKGVNQ